MGGFAPPPPPLDCGPVDTGGGVGIGFLLGTILTPLLIWLFLRKSKLANPEAYASAMSLSQALTAHICLSTCRVTWQRESPPPPPRRWPSTLTCLQPDPAPPRSRRRPGRRVCPKDGVRRPTRPPDACTTITHRRGSHRGLGRRRAREARRPRAGSGGGGGGGVRSWEDLQVGLQGESRGMRCLWSMWLWVRVVCGWVRVGERHAAITCAIIIHGRAHVVCVLRAGADRRDCDRRATSDRTTRRG